jgi:hypothetical protein
MKLPAAGCGVLETVILNQIFSKEELPKLLFAVSLLDLIIYERQFQSIGKGDNFLACLWSKQ